MQILENSTVSLLDFAFQAAGGDGVVSDQEIKALASNSNLMKVLKSLDINTQLKSEFLIREEEDSREYLKAVTESDINFSIDRFYLAGSRISAISLQPLAIAFAIYVSSSDGLDDKENSLILDQKATWDCEEEDINLYLEKLKET